MNNERRKQIKDLIDQLETFKENVSMINDEEQESYDNIPEQFQQSDNALKSEQAINSLDFALSGLEQAFDALNEIVE